MPGAQFDPDLLGGWGNRFYELGVLDQRAARGDSARVGSTSATSGAGYGNFQVTDNLLVEACGLRPTSASRHHAIPGCPMAAATPSTGSSTSIPAKFGQSLELQHAVEEVRQADRALERRGRHAAGADVGRRSCSPAASARASERPTTARSWPRLPEMLLSAQNLATAAGVGGTITTNVWLPHAVVPAVGAVRHADEGLRQLYGAAVDVQVSAAFQSIPGPIIAANYIVNNAAAQAVAGPAAVGRRREHHGQRRRAGLTVRRTAQPARPSIRQGTAPGQDADDGRARSLQRLQRRHDADAEQQLRRVAAAADASSRPASPRSPRSSISRGNLPCGRRR